MREEEVEANKITVDTFIQQRKWRDHLINKAENWTINNFGNNRINGVANLTIIDFGNNIISNVASLKINDVRNYSNRATPSDVQVQFSSDTTKKFSPKLIEQPDDQD